MRLQVPSTRYCRWCVYVVHVRCVQCVAHGDSGAAIVVLYGTVSGVFYVVHVHSVQWCAHWDAGAANVVLYGTVSSVFYVVHVRYVIILHAFSIALFLGERAERVYLHTFAYICL